MSLVAGIFVGGRSTRMGRAKALMPAISGDVSLVEYWIAALREADTRPVLVGRCEGLDVAGVEVVDDVGGSDAGPLGGLVALLRRAQPGNALAIACDMPFVSSMLLRRLVDTETSTAVAPRRFHRWEPLFAHYHAPSVLPIAERHLATGVGSLQRLLDAVGASELPLSGDESAQLNDWDSPDDVARFRRAPPI